MSTRTVNIIGVDVSIFVARIRYLLEIGRTKNAFVIAAFTSYIIIFSIKRESTGVTMDVCR